MQNTVSLGMGLKTLLGNRDEMKIDMNDKKSRMHSVHIISLDEIETNKDQPRKIFKKDVLEELASSIKENGVIQPIIVRQINNGEKKYQIIAGERRVRASKLAKLKTIPAIIKNLSDSKTIEFAIIENVQREDLSPIEEANAYKGLIEEFEYSHERVAKSVGKSRSQITNMLRLLTLPEEIQNMLNAEMITMGHARCLINAPDKLKIAQKIIEEGLSVRETEDLVKRGTLSIAEYQASNLGHNELKSYKDEYIKEMENALSSKLNMPVSISFHPQRQNGKITISYDSVEEIDELLTKIDG